MVLGPLCATTVTVFLRRIASREAKGTRVGRKPNEYKESDTRFNMNVDRKMRQQVKSHPEQGLNERDEGEGDEEERRSERKRRGER